MARTSEPGRGLRWGLLADTLVFAWVHRAPVAAACILAAGGRFVQAGWADTLPWGGSLALEVVVAVARLGLLLIAVGDGHLGGGVRTVRACFAQPEQRHAAWLKRVVERVRRNAWSRLALEVIGLVLLAVLLNLLIVYVSSMAPLLAWTARWVENPERAQDALVMCMKNFSVIPLVLLVQVRLVADMARHHGPRGGLESG